MIRSCRKLLDTNHFDDSDHMPRGADCTRSLPQARHLAHTPCTSSPAPMNTASVV
jgi:hypothetical protein